jgi:multidrug resistance efflux pump
MLMLHRMYKWSGRLFGRSSSSTPSDDEEDGEVVSTSTGAVAKAVESKARPRRSPWPKRIRRLAWAGCLAGAVFLLARKETELRVFGPFRVLPAATTQVRASVDGILEQVYVDEGDRVEPGDRIARLSDKDLRASLEKNAAELREAQAKLRMLEAGPTQAEIEVAKAGIRSAEQLAEYAASRFERTRMLIAEGVLPKNRLEEVREMVIKTTGEVEEARARLGAVLHAVRPEQIEATRAQIERLDTERAYIETQMEMLDIRTPVRGVVGTPAAALRQLRQQMIKKGDEVVKVHDARAMQAEISISEKDIAEVGVGQPVELMLRAHPGLSLRGKVNAISVAAVATTDADPPLFALGGPVQKAGTLLVRTQLEGSPDGLRPDMTGQARIHCGRRTLAGLAAWRVARVLNTEFWSWL